MVSATSEFGNVICDSSVVCLHRICLIELAVRDQRRVVLRQSQNYVMATTLLMHGTVVARLSPGRHLLNGSGLARCNAVPSQLMPIASRRLLGSWIGQVAYYREACSLRPTSAAWRSSTMYVIYSTVPKQRSRSSRSIKLPSSDRGATRTAAVSFIQNQGSCAGNEVSHITHTFTGYSCNCV